MGYELRNPIVTSELCDKLNLEYSGIDIKILGVTSIDDQMPGFLIFSKSLSELKPGSIGICPESELHADGVTTIFTNSPRFEFIRALDFLARTVGFNTFDFSSEVHPSVEVGQNVVIERGCIIHENVVIEHNCVIHAGTIIGANSRVRSSADIGGDGFGFERYKNGIPIRFPHLGGVTIGENVEIGSFTAICRGALSNTIIGNYVKIDNLVHIAHNCIIKKGAFIIACAELSGGVVVEENAWISPNSCINQKLSVGANSIVGLGAVVTKNIPGNTVYVGNPAKKLKDL